MALCIDYGVVLVFFLGRACPFGFMRRCRSVFSRKPDIAVGIVFAGKFTLQTL